MADIEPFDTSDTFESKQYPIFELFNKQWALVTAGTPERFNTCTVSWGSMGTLWSRPVITVYLHPSRYTTSFLLAADTFTVSFFPPACRPALSILGTRSGRDGDKVAASGLTPVPLGSSVAFAEATQTFLCRKISQQQFAKEGLAPDIRAIYANKPQAFPPDDAGNWQPHWVFVGEVIDAPEQA